MSSLSCPGCLPTGKALAQLYETTYHNAVKFSQDNKTDVAIYKDFEGYSFIKMSAEILGKYDIKEIITYKRT